MELKNRLFCAGNPARIDTALWQLMTADGDIDLADILVFLPSRRAVRAVEKMIVRHIGHAAILPRLVALGEGADEFTDQDDDDIRDADVISNTERVVMLAQLVAADANVGTLGAALPVARDLMRMADYLENEGVDAATVNWASVVDEKYSEHFQAKAGILEIISKAMPQLLGGRVTSAARRNADVRAWIDYIASPECTAKKIIVCASTASVPATADLMAAIANDERGRIILSGKIADKNLRECDMALDTNPYNSEYKLLTRLGVKHTDVGVIDVGQSAIDFMNVAFGNDPLQTANGADVSHCKIVECPRESAEAIAVAEITARAIKEHKSVLVITPDAAGNQRIATAFAARNINADFSGGRSGNLVPAGRALLNILDDWMDKKSDEFDALYAAADGNLLETVIAIVDTYGDVMRPKFGVGDAESLPVWRAVRDMSDAIARAKIKLNIADARAFIADALGATTVRDAARKSDVCVLGTIESRMQTADVVILTGLNDGMFPSRGYENAWLPRAAATAIGLPPGDRKISLMSLDFMNLSCGGDVWWTRSKMSGGAQTAESRFISRVAARRGDVNGKAGADILAAVADLDNVESHRLDYSPPTPPADFSPVYVTELELLMHNPYAFYVRHILRLYKQNDYWEGVSPGDFGNVVHDVLRDVGENTTADDLVARMDAAAKKLLGDTGVIFHFWHRRFMEIAPYALEQIRQLPPSVTEIEGETRIANRVVRARADRIWDGGVMDIKTGTSLPPQTKMTDGNMPQLPLEAYILSRGGFPIGTTEKSALPTILFLQLASGKLAVKPYDADTVQEMVNGTLAVMEEKLKFYSRDGAPYENRVWPRRSSYSKYDDLARTHDDD